MYDWDIDIGIKQIQPCKIVEGFEPEDICQLPLSYAHFDNYMYTPCFVAFAFSITNFWGKRGFDGERKKQKGQTHEKFQI